MKPKFNGQYSKLNLENVCLIDNLHVINLMLLSNFGNFTHSSYLRSEVCPKVIIGFTDRCVNWAFD